MSTILYIEEEDMKSCRVLDFIHHDERSHLYWSRDWTATLYSRLAYEGLISTSYVTENGETVLLPEMQRAYAVLNWDKLHICRHIKKKIRNEAGPELTINKDYHGVIKSIREYHDPCWLTTEYASILDQLYRAEEGGCRVLSVELWDHRGRLAAGEVGYQIGAVYTSLSGFCRREGRETNFGTCQMVMLALKMAQHGMHFWNLGHPDMPYKIQLGAEVLERGDFLKIWKKSRNAKLDLLQ